MADKRVGTRGVHRDVSDTLRLDRLARRDQPPEWDPFRQAIDTIVSRRMDQRQRARRHPRQLPAQPRRCAHQAVPGRWLPEGHPTGGWAA